MKSWLGQRIESVNLFLMSNFLKPLLVLVLMLPFVSCKKTKDGYYQANFSGQNSSLAFPCMIDRKKNTISIRGIHRDDKYFSINGELTIDKDKITGVILYKYNGQNNSSTHKYSVNGGYKRKVIEGNYTSVDTTWSTSEGDKSFTDSGTFKIFWMARKEPK